MAKFSFRRKRNNVTEKKGTNESGFDLYELAARNIFNEYSPDKFVETDRNGPVSQVMLVVGVGRMAAALIRRASRLGHFSKPGKLLLLWVDPNVESAAKALFAECPNLNTRELGNSPMFG